jgi:tetratricopeptide (TPR) repeat protein
MWNSRMVTVAVAAAALMLGAGLFWDGLYAPGQQLLPVAVLAVAALVAGNDVGLALSEGVALLLVTAGVSLSLINPAAWAAAAHGPAIAAGWLLAWAFGRRLAADGRLERYLALTWAVAGPLMVFGGLAAMSYLPAHHSGRLPAFLGYPIAVGVLGLVGLAGSLPDLARGRWWAPALAAGNAMAVLLSGSRGVWAVAVLLAAYLAWAQFDLVRRAAWPLVCALAGALWAGPAVAEAMRAGPGVAVRAPWPALAAVLLSCLTAVLPVRLRAAGVGSALALAPGWPWLLGRATALPLTEGSSVERLTFLVDGWQLARHLPLGAGYRAWAALHLQAASYNYYSAEVHSAPLDLALAFGWAGALGFLLLLGRFLWGLRLGRDWAPYRVAVLAGLGAVALHSLLDWDLSYGAFMVPLWLGFGLMGPVGPRFRVPAGAVGALAGLALAAVVVLGVSNLGITLSERALAAGDAGRAVQHAALARAVAPWSDLAHLREGQALSRLGRHEAAATAFERARAWGAYEPWYPALHARELLALGQPREAAAAYREYVRLWPWSPAAYEEALEAHMDLIFRASLAGDQALAHDLLESGRAVLAALDRQKAKESGARPRQPMNVETPTIRRARQYLGG